VFWFFFSLFCNLPLKKEKTTILYFLYFVLFELLFEYFLSQKKKKIFILSHENLLLHHLRVLFTNIQIPLQYKTFVHFISFVFFMCSNVCKLV
jgi:hypothetical protein